MERAVRPGGVRRVLPVLLGLSLALSLLPASRPAGADEPRVTLEAKWLLLRKEDVSEQVVQLPDRTTDDGQAQLTVRQFDPNWKGREDHPPTPTKIVDNLWLARDLATAQQIFAEQSDAGFPEAPGDVKGAGELSGLPSMGDDVHGLGGCGPCDSGVVHFRIVFRYLNAVHALYVFGPQEYAYRDVAVGYALKLDERVHSSPTGPAPDKMSSVGPREVALALWELGKEIDPVGEHEGSDERSQWYDIRFKRGKEAEPKHIGPLDIYNKIWVARDLDTAHEIYDEQAQPGFPEAEQTVGGEFPMDFTPGIGNENFGWSACNDDCNTAKFRYLHHRFVMRVGNVVSVLYAWGGNKDTSINQVSFWAQSIRNRIK